MPPVSRGQCIIGTEKNPDACTTLNLSDGKYSEGHQQSKEACRCLTSDGVLPSGKSDHDFRFQRC